MSVVIISPAAVAAAYSQRSYLSWVCRPHWEKIGQSVGRIILCSLLVHYVLNLANRSMSRLGLDVYTDDRPTTINLAVASWNISNGCICNGSSHPLSVSFYRRPVSHSRFSPTPADSVLNRRQPTHIVKFGHCYIIFHAYIFGQKCLAAPKVD